METDFSDEVIDDISIAIAFEYDFNEVVRLLNTNPGLAKYRDPNCDSWIHWASKFGRADVVKELLRRGLDVNLKSGRFEGAIDGPLIESIQAGHFEVSKTLLESGADPNQGRTLIAAINATDGRMNRFVDEKLNLVKLLVDHGANVNRSFHWHGTDDWHTALSWAEGNKYGVIADYLRQCGAVGPNDPKAIRDEK